MTYVLTARQARGYDFMLSEYTNYDMFLITYIIIILIISFKYIIEVAYQYGVADLG